MKTIQRERVWQFMNEHGYINRNLAASELGCHELSSRIGELEHEGKKIVRTNRTGKNRYGDPVRWIDYSPKKDEQ